VFPPSEMSGRPLYAIGDVHGDAARLIKILTAHGLIDVSLGTVQWKKPRVVVLLLGDVIDAKSRHGPHGDAIFEKSLSDMWILEFLRTASREAESMGSKVVAILGNHELMNFRGEMQYASPHHCKRPTARKEYFLSGGGRAVLETMYHTSIVYNGNHYSHAGIPLHATDSQRRMIGKKVSGALLALARNPHLEELVSHRDYADVPDGEQDGSELASRVHELCQEYGVARMVTGHNFTNGQGVVSAYGGRVVYADAGISRAFTPQQTMRSLDIVFDPGDGNLQRMQIDGSVSPIPQARR
jgi:hypothetical protein